MKKLTDYTISLVQLSYGKHQFHYDIDDAFFADFEQDIVEKGTISIDLELDKGDALMELSFQIKGNTELTCDRSLEKFDYEMNFEKKLFLKYGETYEELNDELIQIPSTQQEYNVGQLIFEFVSLQIPIKKLHPKFDGEEDFFFTSSTDNENNQETKSNEEEVDPRWKDLIKLKSKK